MKPLIDVAKRPVYRPDLETNPRVGGENWVPVVYMRALRVLRDIGIPPSSDAWGVLCEWVFEPAKECVLVETSESAHIRDEATQSTFTVNPLGKVIWSGLAEGLTVTDLAEAVAETGIPVGQALGDVAAFVSRLLDEELVCYRRKGNEEQA